MLNIEGPCEVIAVSDAVNSVVNADVDAKVQVSPSVAVPDDACLPWDLLSLQENALQHSAVFFPGFIDVDRIVVQVIVESNFSNPVVFFGVLDHRLLEIALEPEDFAVKLEPRRLDPWHVIVLRLLSNGVCFSKIMLLF